MFLCNFCSRQFGSQPGLTFHVKYCNKNPAGIVHPLRGKPGSNPTGKARSAEAEQARVRKIREHALASGLGGYQQGSGRGKKGWYKGYFCDSSWELAFVIYCLDHNMHIERNTEKRQYTYNNKTKNYIPDFIVESKLVEIKGYKTDEWKAKLADNSDVTVLYEKEMKPILDYVKHNYGNGFIRLYEKG